MPDSSEPIDPRHRPGPSQPTLWAGVVAALAAAGPVTLLWLAGFGQAPPDRLPVLATAMLGAVFIGPLSDLLGGTQSHARSRALLVAGVAGVLAGVALLLGGVGDPTYLLSPVVAVISTWLLSRFTARPGLYPAVSVYVACTLLANYTLDSFLPLGGFFLVNVGTLFFGITFTQRDRVHRYGRRAVYQMILVAAVANVVLGAALGTPVRYVAVSFLSIVLAETADTEVFQRLRSRRWLTRVATSNAVSAPIDTIIFTLLAFWGESFATPAWMTQVIVTDVLVKYGSGLAAALGMVALVRSALTSLAPLGAGQRGDDEQARRGTS
jgi:uncharacterized PurR-regulated membrane protein YhhQ (DUF165 family)